MLGARRPELDWCLRQESNLYLALRRHSFYPLNYGGGCRILAVKPIDQNNVPFRIGQAMRQDGLVFRAVVPSFGCSAAWKFNHYLAKSLGLAFQLRVFPTPDQIFAAMWHQRRRHMLRILLVALRIVNCDLSNEIGFGHVDSKIF